jgi:hypothetical protein
MPLFKSYQSQKRCSLYDAKMAVDDKGTKEITAFTVFLHTQRLTIAMDLSSMLGLANKRVEQAGLSRAKLKPFSQRKQHKSNYPYVGI